MALHRLSADHDRVCTCRFWIGDTADGQKRQEEEEEEQLSLWILHGDCADCWSSYISIALVSPGREMDLGDAGEQGGR